LRFRFVAAGLLRAAQALDVRQVHAIFPTRVFFPMSPLDALWHLTNFLAPACIVAALTAAGLKLLWRRELKSLSWRRLAGWGAVGGSLGLVAALVLLGRDGHVAGYGLMILAITLPQWGLTLRR
jgi:hypothetical protein